MEAATTNGMGAIKSEEVYGSKVITSNDPSLDYSILNSPSSSHRLQTSLRKKTPLAGGAGGGAGDGDERIELKGRTVSPTSHSTIDSEQFSADEQLLVSMVNARTNDSEAGVANKCQKEASSHDYFLRRVADWHRASFEHRFTLLHLAHQCAMFMLPLIWIGVVIVWALHFRESNLLAEKLNQELPPEELQRTFPQTLVWKVTLAGMVATTLLLGTIIARSHWPYSFVFIPNDHHMQHRASDSSSGAGSARGSLKIAPQRPPPPSTNYFDSDLSLLRKPLIARRPKPANLSKVRTTDSAKRKSIENIETNVIIYKAEEKVKVIKTVGSPKIDANEASEVPSILYESSFPPLKKPTTPGEIQLNMPEQI